MRIKEKPLKERPREKLLYLGKENLSDSDIISIILKTGLKGENVENISLNLIKKYSLEDLKEIEFEELTSIKGIGKVKAIELLACIELGKRIYLKENIKLTKLSTPKDIFNYIKYLFIDKKQEYFYCLYFNNKQELLKRKLLFLGTINNSVTHTREIFKEAYKLSASSIVCIHNHPSNDVTPSKADIKFTNCLVKTGNIQGIPIIDHIIVGDSNFYSFYEHNIIEDNNNL